MKTTTIQPTLTAKIRRQGKRLGVWLGGVLAVFGGTAASADGRRIEFDPHLKAWAVEQMPGGTVEARGSSLIIEDKDGCTVWLRQKLTAPVKITYDVLIVSNGGPLDRVSDVNCFWMAAESATGTMPSGRSGRFEAYDSLKTYYVGMGGNENTTTRFRRYIGDGSKPLLPQHDLKATEFLLQPNRTYHLKVVAREGIAEFWRDDKLIFSFHDPAPLTEGWFAFRTVHSHLEIRNFWVNQ